MEADKMNTFLVSWYRTKRTEKEIQHKKSINLKVHFSAVRLHDLASYTLLLLLQAAFSHLISLLLFTLMNDV
jgi:hypothetical protein